MTMMVKGVKNKVEKNMILRRNLPVIYLIVRTIVRAAMKKESLRRKEAMIRILTSESPRHPPSRVGARLPEAGKVSTPMWLGRGGGARGRAIDAPPSPGKPKWKAGQKLKHKKG